VGQLLGQQCQLAALLGQLGQCVGQGGTIGFQLGGGCLGLLLCQLIGQSLAA